MSFKKLVDAYLAEDSPPGFKGTVKAMKDHNDIDNPYALAWWQKNQGYQSHKKADGASKEEGVGYDTIEESEHLTQNVTDGIMRTLAMEFPDVIKKYGEDAVRQEAHQQASWLTDDWPEDEGFGSSDSYGPYKSTLEAFGLDLEAERKSRTRGAYDPRLLPDSERPNESIRVEHPVHGTGTVEAITETNIEITWDNLDKRLSIGNTLAFADAKYLTRLHEEYTDNPEDAEVGRKKDPKMVKKKGKKKVDESIVAVGMAAIGGTHRGNETVARMDDDIIRFEDLLEDGDEWNKPWEEDDSDSDSDSDSDGSAEGGEGTENRAPDQDTTKGADYTNVPRPADSILTNQDDQPSYSADPLSTKAGAEAAGEGSEPDGDYQDINPVDAPETPQVRDLEGSSDRGNTRDTGDGSDDTSEADAGDYDESKPETDGGEDKMKNESAWLSADDLGIDLTEMEMGTGYAEDGMDGGMNEHDMGAGEVALTHEFLDKLLAAVSSQAPDEAKLAALCAGLKSAQGEKGDAGLDVSDWDAIKSAAAAEYSGGGDEMGDPVGDEGGEDEYGGEEADDEYDDEFEDKAAGDGEVAGAEGGEEHEGKTQMMDCEGDMYEKKVDQDGKPRGERPGRDQKSMKRRGPKKSQQYENKGKGTPIGTGSTSGSGGGSQTDLSKPKSYKGKPVGTGTSGAGGSNSNEFGQKPTNDGGSNNLPEYESGNQLGADNTTFNSDAGKPAPRSSKPLAAEGKKRYTSKQKLDEAIMLGMSGIPGTIRNDNVGVPSDVDWDEEMNVIRRRAGIENWWQD